MKVSKRFLEIIYYYKNPKNECFGWPRTYPSCGLQHPKEIRPLDISLHAMLRTETPKNYQSQSQGRDGSILETH